MSSLISAWVVALQLSHFLLHLDSPRHEPLLMVEYGLRQAYFQLMPSRRMDHQNLQVQNYHCFTFNQAYPKNYHCDSWTTSSCQFLTAAKVSFRNTCSSCHSHHSCCLFCNLGPCPYRITYSINTIYFT